MQASGRSLRLGLIIPVLVTLNLDRPGASMGGAIAFYFGVPEIRNRQGYDGICALGWTPADLP